MKKCITQLTTAAKCLVAAGLLSVSSIGSAEVTIPGWPGGPEETALRAAAETYSGRTGSPAA